MALGGAATHSAVDTSPARGQVRLENGIPTPTVRLEEAVVAGGYFSNTISAHSGFLSLPHELVGAVWSSCESNG